MLFEHAMMKRWMGRKSPEGIAAMMKEMMPLMFEKMGPGGMANMMPTMMEGSFEMMKPEEMERMMHDAMPKMMDHCFSKMDDSQRRSVLSMCRESLDRMEEKFLEPAAS
ncbi:MAG: hypothetical protein BZY87_08000 [SAR202 cluster bacterium Io17-Chloro-G6]|nr:MAG: hypothetical protein BZY87_08000 [SAR202 cluster bacterium Io17-Chloro-G6]